MPNVSRPEMEFVEEWRKMWEADVEAIAYNGATCDPTRVDPKVLHWVKSNFIANKPHFIKVINDTASFGWLPPPGTRDPVRQQCKLFVPRPFVREHFRKLGRVITLENGTTHKKWKVSFGAPKKQPSWLQGWKRVAVGNQLSAGDVMVFVLTGDSHFVFHLFDEYGLPKEASAVKNEPNGNVNTHDDDDPVTESERSFDDKCTSKLFDPDIVKLERGGDAAMVSSEEAACAKWSGSPLPAPTDMGEETITTEPPSTPIHRMSGEGSEAVEEEGPEHGPGIMASFMHHERQVPPSLPDLLVPPRIWSPLPDLELPATDMAEETITTPMRREASPIRMEVAKDDSRPGQESIIVPPVHSESPLDSQRIGPSLPHSELTATDMVEETITSAPIHQMSREGSEAVLEVERPEHGPGIMAASFMHHHRQVPPLLDLLVPQRIEPSLPDSELTAVTDMVEETGQRSTPERSTERLQVGGSTNQMKGRPLGRHGGIMVSNAHDHRQVPVPVPVPVPPLDPLAFLIKSRRRIPSMMERKRAREQAKAHAELLVGYRFLVVLSDSQVYRDFHLALPERFVSDSGLPRTRTQLRLVDWSGKEWEMHSRMNKSGVVAFHRKYWGVFALQHFLEEGDVCVFQLLNKGTLVISVCIFRVVKLLDRSNVDSVHHHYDMRLKPTHP